MPEVLAFLVFLILSIPLPLSAILVLLVDLGTELAPAMSFSAELPEGDLMLVPPRKVLTTAERASAGQPLHVVVEEQPVVGARGFLKRAWTKFTDQFKREETGEVLVDNDLLLWAYLQGGMLEAVGCFGAYLAVLACSKVPFGMLYRSAGIYFKTGAPDLVLTDGTVVPNFSQHY